MPARGGQSCRRTVSSTSTATLRPARPPACAGPWPRPRSATSSAARILRPISFRNGSRICSAKRRRCSCRRARCAIRSPCWCTAGKATRSSARRSRISSRRKRVARRRWLARRRGRSAATAASLQVPTSKPPCAHPVATIRSPRSWSSNKPSTAVAARSGRSSALPRSRRLPASTASSCTWTARA